MTRLRQLTLLLLAFACCLRPAAAWEADMHYGLVKWLAYRAGFSLQDAEIVAASSEAADETHVLMATYLIAEVCARGRAPKITAVSRVVQQHHFPAPEHVPNSPTARDVRPGHYGQDRAGNRWIRQEIKDATAMLSPLVILERFGSSIHPLADSWSHAGHPDVPDKWFLRCRRPELVWSHPQSRGGWQSHDADITHLHVQDTLQTAETTYRFMIDFLQGRGQFATRPPTDWAILRALVRDFATRSTRDAKFDWFMSEDERHGSDPNDGLPYDAFTTYPCFLEETSLKKRDRREDYPRTRCARREAGLQQDLHETAPPMPPLQNVPDSPWVFTYDLLETWLVGRNVSRVLTEMSDLPAIARGFAAESAAAAAMTDIDLVEVLLNLWLVDDHGVVNELGHGSGDIGALRNALNNPFFTASGPLPTVRYDALAEVARHPCSSLPFELIRSDYPSESPDGEPITVESYVVTFQLRHAPRDLMMLTIERRDGAWQLTSIAWAAQ